MIIDFRLRPPMKSFTGLSIFNEGIVQLPVSFGAEPVESARQSSMELLIQEMKESGVTQGVVMGRQAGSANGSVSNDEIVEIVNSYPGSFIPFAGANLMDIKAALKEIDRAINELGFKGVAVDPGWAEEPLYADDRRIYPIYAKCDELGVPVSITTSIALGPNVSYSSPVSIHKIANDFPNLQIVVPHAAWPWVTEMLGVAFAAPNVWLSPDLYMNIPNIPGATHFVEAANHFLGDRLLYASAYPIRSLRQSMKNFMELPIKDEVKEKILYKNAARLLSID